MRENGTHLGCRGRVDFASYAEPSDDVVAETSPDSLHRYLASSPAPKLAESTSLFHPGVRELSDLRSLTINLFCRLGLHLGFEGCGSSGIYVARNRSSPPSSSFLRTTLITELTPAACCFRCLVDMRAHTIFLLLDHVKSKTLPGGTEVNIMLSVVRK